MIDTWCQEVTEETAGMLYTTFIVIPLTTLLVLNERHFYTLFSFIWF